MWDALALMVDVLVLGGLPDAGRRGWYQRSKSGTRPAHEPRKWCTRWQYLW